MLDNLKLDTIFYLATIYYSMKDIARGHNDHFSTKKVDTHAHTRSKALLGPLVTNNKLPTTC